MNKQTERITILVTKEQKINLEEQARQKGVSVGSYIKNKVF